MTDTSTTPRRLSAPAIAARKGAQPLACLTAYTAPIAKAMDTHCDLILVGDSVAMVVYGMESTLGADIPMMIRHGQAVVRATQKACVVVDLPFGTYQASPAQAFETAAQILRETGAQAVKLEGGAEMAKTVAFLTARGIPVMGHIGLQPQSVNTLGGYKAQGRDDNAAQRIRKDAQDITNAGAFAIVIEGVAEPLAAAITREIRIPTIGIGASAACDGQILVSDDMLGITQGKKPKFVKEYAALSASIESAIKAYAQDVRARAFPGEAHVYAPRPAQQPAAANAPVNDRTPQQPAPQPQAQPQATRPQTMVPGTPAPSSPSAPTQTAQPASAPSPFSMSAFRSKEASADADTAEENEKPATFAYNILRAIPRRGGRDD